MSDSYFPVAVQSWGLVGGFSGIVGFLSWVTAHRISKTNAENALAERKKVLAETSQMEIDNLRRIAEDAKAEANRVEARRVDFERALNERAVHVMDSLKNQVSELSALVRLQSEQIQKQGALIQAQSVRIQEMEHEIQALRVALDKTTQDLHQARQNSCPVLPWTDPIG